VDEATLHMIFTLREKSATERVGPGGGTGRAHRGRARTVRWSR